MRSRLHKFDRSIIKIVIKASLIVIEASLIAIEASQNRYKAPCLKSKPPPPQEVPQNRPTLWALNTHSTGNECPLLGLPMPDT